MSTETLVLVQTRDLLFRARLEAMIRARGAVPVRPGSEATVAVVELSDDAAVEACRALVDSGVRVLAFGPHVEAERLRAARAAGADAVPNSQLDARLGQMLTTA